MVSYLYGFLFGQGFGRSTSGCAPFPSHDGDDDPLAAGLSGGGGSTSCCLHCEELESEGEVLRARIVGLVTHLRNVERVVADTRVVETALGNTLGSADINRGTMEVRGGGNVVVPQILSSFFVLSPWLVFIFVP